MRGTPKSLNAAISNAFSEFEKEPGVGSIPRLKKIIKKHILDFNRQGVAAVILKDEKDLSRESLKALSRLAERKF